jgi:hypothetical protein
MCDYIIKHYWSEKSYGATIEPEWITSSSDNLTEEQKKIKEVVQKLLVLKNYNRIAKEKPKQEEIDGYTIKYSYLDKDDPDPTNDRKVTDITFCINVNKKNNLDLYLVIFAIIIFIVIAIFLSLKNITNKESNQKPIEKNVTEIHKNITSSVKKEEKVVIKHKESLLEKVCSQNLKFKKSDRCWKYYIDELNCNKNAKNKTFLEWFKSLDKEYKHLNCPNKNETNYFDFDYKDLKYGKNEELKKLLDAKEIK